MTVDAQKRDRVISDAVRAGKIAASAAPEFRRRWDRWPVSTEQQIEQTPPDPRVEPNPAGPPDPGVSAEEMRDLFGARAVRPSQPFGLPDPQPTTAAVWGLG